ncbi:hypothetical protein AOXY_G30616 [Acipenser oxyrinchus oxyrinchus]|uniref:Uncharacterized protein n=1 Tax=Acipenser oxyrinchus oxyrinchus TaxID=40147 RepID=A0AAD8FQ09_ACIOX|nr:hypothetical protein AOXY_G30616 [Acipenser oxyrinchus oxyrinchus]
MNTGQEMSSGTWLQRFRRGDFVLVDLHMDEKSTKTFVAQVQEVDEQMREVWLKYMTAPGAYYRWPVKDDISWESWSRIQKILQPPNLVVEKSSSRIQMYNFSMK